MLRSTPSQSAALAARRRLLPLAALAMASCISSTSYAIEIVSIEEHWALSVGQPDAASSSPQVSMVMSPTGHLESSYFVFTLNHHSDPEWIPGGLQVQFWNGSEIVDSKVGPQEATLNHAEEVVTWVQRTSVADGSLTFEIASGQSDTWGAFGGAGHLKFMVDTNLTSLNGYRPAISLEESGVCFAGNRVKSLTLTKLRWTDAEGHVYEMAAPIDVDADLDP